MWSTFLVGYYVKNFLSQTYLKTQQFFLCYLIGMQDVREKATRIFRAEVKEIIANESTVDEDSTTYLACFDSDSFHIGIDKLCTGTLSDKKSYFQDLRLYNGKSVTGIAEGLEIAGEGTFVSLIEDDDGQSNAINIPCSFYVIGVKLPLLSPQHWAETAKDKNPIKYGTKIKADDDGCTLLWQQQTRQKRVNLDPLTNKPIFQTQFHPISSF